MADLNSQNPNNWKGIFYFNKKDSRVMVPKQNPAFGWTFNMANPLTWLGIIAIFAMAILFTMFF